MSSYDIKLACPDTRISKMEATPSRLDVPSTAAPLRIDWPNLFGLLAVHVIALLAFVPWFFSWTGVAIAFLGHYFVGTLGIGLGFHRLLAHRSLKCSKRLEHILSTLGVFSMQYTPARWVAVHRMHHQHCEGESDPHSPLVNFLWSHMGWIVFVNRSHDRVPDYESYVPDILRDGYYRRLESWPFLLCIYGLSLVAFSALGFGLGYVMTENHHGRRADGSEHPRMGRLRSHRDRVARDVVGELARRTSSATALTRRTTTAVKRSRRNRRYGRGVAQQPPRGSQEREARAPVVGDRRHVDDDLVPGKARARPRR